LESRHSLTAPKLTHINTNALHPYIESLRIQKRATVLKLLHGWVPTYSSLCCQGRSHTSVCLCCQTFVETSSHVSICPAESAVSQQIEHLRTFLSELESQQTSIYLLTIFEYKLSLILNLMYQQTFTITIPASPTQQQILMKASRHQNLVGWDNFLWGYISIY